LLTVLFVGFKLELKAKYENQKRHYTEVISQLRRTSPPPEDQAPAVSTCKSQHNKKLTEYQEKIMLLNTQLHAYKEDFEAEKRDKDRLKSEKSTEKLRLEAEIASLKIQLDRSNSDLSQYKSEAIRLFHQLRLKQHREDEEYRRHLEKQVKLK
jgi:chromosome segregation ATPase